MKARTCLYCTNIVQNDKRGDAKFCSDVCRYKYRNQKLKETRPEFSVNTIDPDNTNGTVSTSLLENQLRGIVEPPKPPVPETHYITETTQTFNKAYVEQVRKKISIQNDLIVIDQAITFCQKNLAKLGQPISNKLPTYTIGGMSGAYIGNAIQQNIDTSKNNEQDTSKSTPVSQTSFPIGALLGGLAGLGVAHLFSENKELEEQEQARKNQADIQKLRAKLKEFQAYKAERSAMLTACNLLLASLPRMDIHTMQKPVLVMPAPQQEKQSSAEKENTIGNVEQPSNIEEQPANLAVSIPVNKDTSIMNSLQVQQLDYKALDFKGDWLRLFGQPSTNFHLVIHGLPGQGKSCFSLLFAKYLADNNGRVVYVSGEEGYSKTMRDKILHHHSGSESLDIADIRNYEQLITDIEPDVYNFIFIDSLDTLRIDADKMKALRQRYKESSIIAICQSTKDGKMRGSNEIAHDADITVSVNKGIATTTKNRFKMIDMTFEIFKGNNDNGFNLLTTAV